jgi:hypothetical protein
MRLSHHTSRLLLAALATCAVTWAFTAVAVAQPADARPIVAAGQGHPPTIGDTDKTPDAAQVDAVLAGIESDRADAAVAATSSNKDSDIDTIALVLSVAAILTALGAVTLSVTLRGRLLGT